MWEYSHNSLVVNVLKFVTGLAATRYICTSYTCLDNGIFLGHCMFMTNTFCKLFAFLLINQCIMKISFAYLHEYFKSYGSKFVEILYAGIPIFAGLVTFCDRFCYAISYIMLALSPWRPLYEYTVVNLE